MKISILDEPELEFGGGACHIDPRFGIADYGPADVATKTAPHEIRVGIVGSADGIEGVRAWLERCRDEVARKASHQPNLFPSFPGFNETVAFRSTLIFDSRFERTIAKKDLKKAIDVTQPDGVREAVDLYFSELDALSDEGRCDVIVCARPDELTDESSDLSAGEEDEEDEPTERLDFHDLLKARAMVLRVPIQVIRRRTWDKKAALVRSKSGSIRQSVQDEATRAWNIHTALYYKAGGVPWRLPRPSSDLASCHVGISFYRSLSLDSLQTSVAQVFNERGDGVIVRGGQATVSKEDRQPHLTEADSSALLVEALETYRREHHHLPARLVIHKSSRYTEEEIRGFESAAAQLGLHLLELLWIPSSESARLFRTADNPPLRGTLLSLDDDRHVLYTRGSVHFYAAYPGMYVPHPLGLRLVRVERDPQSLGREVLALTKMNWNNTQFDGRQPITMRTSWQVGRVLKYVGPTDPVAAKYAYYM